MIIIKTNRAIEETDIRKKRNPETTIEQIK